MPNVGKSTVFNALTGEHAPSSNYPFCTIDPNVGMVEVPDERLDKIASFVNAKEKKYAVIEFVDIAGLIKGASEGEGLGNKFLSNIRNVDIILHVVRCFSDSQVSHPFPEINPARDVDIVNTELLLADLQVAGKTAEKLKNSEAELKALFDRIGRELNQGRFIKNVSLSRDEKDLLKGFQFLTIKPFVYLANIKENDERSVVLADSLGKKAKEDSCEMIELSAKLEEDIANLPDGEKEEYRRELNAGSGLKRLVELCYDSFGFITFYTIVNEKATAWAIIKGATVKEAAGKVHSDMEKGFIKAEVVVYSELLESGTYEQARSKGRVRVEGRDYEVCDGDVVYFKFHN